MFEIALIIVLVVLTVIIIFLFDVTNTEPLLYPPTYTFWTGGYDSTFRICDLVLGEKKVVQPVYVSALIDNVEGSSTRRRSRDQELATMQTIRQLLPEEARDRLLPLIVINKIRLDDDIKKSMTALYKKKKMRRPTCQYGALAQVTRYLKQNIEVAVEYAPGHSMLYQCIHDSLDCGDIRQGSGVSAKLLPIRLLKDPDLIIFSGFTFPTVSYSKNDMLEIAKGKKFDHILHTTWSCWYPKEDGNPCGKCIMCLERII